MGIGNPLVSALKPFQFCQWHPTPVLLPGKSHGRRSLVGCSPWGREESDMTERLHFHFSLSCIGEGNGNPLQCSCLENPMDSGAWWAAVYGVSQSRTRLKRQQQQYLPANSADPWGCLSDKWPLVGSAVSGLAGFSKPQASYGCLWSVRSSSPRLSVSLRHRA